jgi:hypothetical protein
MLPNLGCLYYSVLLAFAATRTLQKFFSAAIFLAFIQRIHTFLTLPDPDPSIILQSASKNSKKTLIPFVL